MKRTLLFSRTAIILLALLAFNGCSYHHIGLNTKKDALIGAGTGAVVTAVAGGGIVTGTIVGAAIGGGIGHLKDRDEW